MIETSSLNTSRQRTGFSLIETAIVLGVMGLVIGGIWVGASAVNEAIKQRQLVEGLSFYLDYIGKTYPKALVSSLTAYKDIDGLIVNTVPPPSGWTVSGAHPIDPYGHPLYMSLQVGGVFTIGYPWQTLSDSLCRGFLGFILDRSNDNSLKITYANLTGGNANCVWGDKLSMLDKCCPNSQLTIYAKLPY